MLPFRLISFFVRVISAFVFVLVLQIQWDGKSLEHYLVQTGKNLVAVKFLNQVGETNAKALKQLGKQKKQRKLSQVVSPLIQDMKQRLSLPDDMLPPETTKPEDSK